MAKSDTCSFGEGVACVLALLALAGALIWMDNATTKELRYTLLAIPVALVIGVLANQRGTR